MKVIITLGPSTRTEADLRKIKAKGVDFVRINMSHSTINDLRYFLRLAKKVGIPFIIDTEGSQIRTGTLEGDSLFLHESDEIKIYGGEGRGNNEKIFLRPAEIISQIESGDILYPDFDTLTLRVSDVSTAREGYVTAVAITNGLLGSNKGVVIHSFCKKQYSLPPLSPKDYESIHIGQEEGVGYILASFMRSAEFVREVRRATKNSMKIISKIECVDGLERLDEIIEASDYLLIDRGDLSKEISIERIKKKKKAIIERARKKDKGVFVATNLLESMIEKRKPTRAEVHDIEATMLDGAYGLALAAETAIGKYPMECINMLCSIISHTKGLFDGEAALSRVHVAHILENKKYLHAPHRAAFLVEPHGGKLVDRIVSDNPDERSLKNSLPKISITDEQYMDAEQIATGVYSPLEGFMCKDDFFSVLDAIRLKNGLVWPIPIILDVSEEDAAIAVPGKDIILVGKDDVPAALLSVEERYRFDKTEVMRKLYGTENSEHPGVRIVSAWKPVLLGGKVGLLKRQPAKYKAYEFTPHQTRRLFEERGWRHVVGFHTRNVPHRGHEFIQREALRVSHADGLFIHPVVGKKKKGDFEAAPIIRSYEIMVKNFYPKNMVVFGTYATYSRYAGPREALFTALCRKNFGCSHFIVGRDHTGVGNFYHPNASHKIFNEVGNIGIVPVLFDRVFYSDRIKNHVHEKEDTIHTDEEKLHISGTEIRKLFEQGKMPPEWFMRPEISKMILEMIKNKEDVFVQ